MKWVVATAEGGHMRIEPTIGGECVQVAIYGPHGGFLGAAQLEASNVPGLQHALDKADQEATEIMRTSLEAAELAPASGGESAPARPSLSAVPELARH